MKKIFYIKKRGFTLIELLAVIVILAIILLIAMPIVLNVIGESRKGAFEASAMGLVKTAENECMAEMVKGVVSLKEIEFGNWQVISEDKLNFSGKGALGGNIYVNEQCKVAMAIHNGDWCIKKEYDEKETVTTPYDGECGLEEVFVFSCNNDGYPCLPGVTDTAIGIGLSYIEPVTEVPSGWVGIYNAGDLKNIENNMAGDYILMNDIDLDGANFEPIGYGIGNNYTVFTGVFNGQGYKVHNGTMSYPEDSYIALFAFLSEATIDNIGIDIIVLGRDNVGGLAGFSYLSVVSKCYSMGNSSGRYSVGGLVGYVFGGSITNCYNRGSVSGLYTVGGLAGHLQSLTLSDCYSTGTVTGLVMGLDDNDRIGGLVGYTSSLTLTNCYSTGVVVGNNNIGGLIGFEGWSSAIIDCYYDATTSGQSDNDGRGEPKTTPEMKDINTFLPEWDIARSSEWTNQIWAID